jgi:hypothetical protein
VCQRLQRVKRGIEPNLRIGQTSADRVGKAEKDRVTRSKDNDMGMSCITGEYLVERNGDVDPLCSGREQWGNNVVMARSS